MGSQPPIKILKNPPKPYNLNIEDSTFATTQSVFLQKFCGTSTFLGIPTPTRTFNVNVLHPDTPKVSWNSGNAKRRTKTALMIS